MGIGESPLLASHRCEEDDFTVSELRQNEDGTVTNWMIEGGSPNALLRAGLTKNALPKGTEILVEGYQAKDKGNLAVGKNITFADGKRMLLGSSAPDTDKK